MTRRIECRRCGALNRSGTPCRCLANYNVMQLEEARPHLTVNCGETVHVLPVSLINDVIAGKIDFTSIERWEELLKTILKDWLSSLNT